jgi:hypothetical protein
MPLDTSSPLTRNSDSESARLKHEKKLTESACKPDPVPRIAG